MAAYKCKNVLPPIRAPPLSEMGAGFFKGRGVRQPLESFSAGLGYITSMMIIRCKLHRGGAHPRGGGLGPPIDTFLTVGQLSVSGAYLAEAR